MFDFKSLPEFSKLFPDEQACITFLEKERWGDHVVSPFDPESKVYKCKGNRYKCKNTGKYFNVRTGTIFENSKVSLRKWMLACYFVVEMKRGVSSLQLSKIVGVTQKTAWFMLQRIHNCFSIEIKEPCLKGEIEVDETYIGGKNKNRHSKDKVKDAQGRSLKDKTPVFGTLQREGFVVAYVVTDTKNGMKYFVDFNVNVVSNFSWGYYFLCEEPDQSAVLSYFSSKEGTTECLHATKIGDYALGKQPKAIIDHFGNISSLNDYFYSFNIITSQGDNPVIMTNNGAFMPSGLINDQSFIYEGDTFNPTDAVYMLTDAVYYVSNGKIYSYNSGLLYRAAKHDKEYYWSNPASAYTYVYVFDELSKKFYILGKHIYCC